MKRLILVVAVMLAAAGKKEKKASNVLGLTRNATAASGVYHHESDPLGNHFRVDLEEGLLGPSTRFMVVLESQSSDLELSILGEEEGAPPVLDVPSFAGNAVLVMSDSFFNGMFDFFKESRSLRFGVVNRARIGNPEYRLRVEVAATLNLDFGKTYTSRVDSTLTDLEVNLRYNGARLNELEKLRFQVTSVEQKRDFSLSATVEHEETTYVLNTVFQRTVGGVLAAPVHKLCRAESCLYKLHLSLSKVKVVNIESFLIPKVEVLSIGHFEEYYDRVYQNDKVTYYNLPYEDSMEEMDVTVSLVPVTGTTGLYVNVKTLPVDLEGFDWKEKGPLAKRVTVRWRELVQMRAEKSNLFIAVFASRPGEFLLKVDAHEQGYRGRLTSGVIESGFVAFDEVNNYLYTFEVFEAQDITFDLRLNTVSGDADLYLRPCDPSQPCQLDLAQLAESSVLKAEGAFNPKLISHTFRCEHEGGAGGSTCSFVVGVRGKENHGTHFEISLHETNFHRLITPGHAIPLSLSSEQTVYLKFSYPGRSKKSGLFLSVEALWGSFDVVLSRKEVYPSSATNAITESFVSAKLGLYNSLKTIPVDLDRLGEETLQGVYYLAVRAKTSCALNLRFFEKSDAEISVHTLSTGHQIRGEVHSAEETIYYTIKLSLESQQASSVSIVLTPLKGQFLLFANRNGRLPTPDNREFHSMNNQLELAYESSEARPNEYVIGVRLNSQHETFPPGNYQFLISMSYSNKPLKLNPGVLAAHLLTQSNLFLVEVTPEMRTLLVLKSVVDGYNIELSAYFSRNEVDAASPAAQFSASDKKVAIFVSEAELDAGCPQTTAPGPRCFLHLRVTGNANQKVTVGFTFNDHPFQLPKNLVVTGPMLLSANGRLNFIFHSEPGKPVSIHFNSKGRDLDFFTKLVRGDHFDAQATMQFPNALSHDQELHLKQGYVTNVIYDEKRTADFGSSPEILVSVRGVGNGAELLDASHHFVLQASMDAQEILRTQTLTQHVSRGAWNYFTFYNNGNTDSLRVYVSTPVTARLEVLLSRGLQARPPLTNKPLVSKVAIGNVQLSLTPRDLLSDRSEPAQLKGHFTVAVKAESDCVLNLFWNNKEDLNYIELTPNTPATMALEPQRSLYFSFYAKESSGRLQLRGLISIYLKATTAATLYVLKSAGELNAPSATEYTWKAELGKTGGVTVLQIRPDHPEYCTECLYIGAVECAAEGAVTLLANLRHDGQAIPLTPGFTFPDSLQPQERLTYKVFNPDAKPLDFSVSMLSGFVNFYVSSKPEVSETSFEESYVLEARLETHKYISIDPARFGVKTAQMFFVLVANPRKTPASFTLTVDKNDLMSPIEPGITKFVHLSPGESGDYMYAPPEDESVFEVRLELRQVYDEAKADEALARLGQMLRVFHVNVKGGRFQISPKSASFSRNKAYLTFDVSTASRGTFALALSNPASTTVAVALDLLNGGYKLLNFNEFSVDAVRGEDALIYEGWGQKSKYLFVDLRVCHGDVSLEFFQQDLSRLRDGNRTDFKKIVTGNSAIHYIQMDHERVFLRVTNKKEALSIFEVSVFNEKDLETNPYTELAQGNKGKVEVETETSTARFAPVTIRQTFSREFFHRVNYTVYLTDDFKAMRFLKGCGTHLIDTVFKDPHILSASQVFKFESVEDIKNATGQVRIQVPNLRLSTKYFGIVIATVEMFPREPGYISPVRSGRVFYDEFVFMSARLNVPLNLLIAILFCLAFFALMFFVVKAYVFGQIGSMRFFDKLGGLANYDVALFGVNVSSILEDEYYGDEDNGAEAEEGIKKNVDADLEGEIKIEMHENKEHKQQ